MVTRFAKLTSLHNDSLWCPLFFFKVTPLATFCGDLLHQTDESTYTLLWWTALPNWLVHTMISHGDLLCHTTDEFTYNRSVPITLSGEKQTLISESLLIAGREQLGWPSATVSQRKVDTFVRQEDHCLCPRPPVWPCRLDYTRASSCQVPEFLWSLAACVCTYILAVQGHWCVLTSSWSFNNFFSPPPAPQPPLFLSFF